jgi:hypothetical protein
MLSASLFGVTYDHSDRALFAPELFMSICKLTNELSIVVATGKFGSGVWSRKQHHVKAFSLRAVNNQSQFREPCKCFAAMRALSEVFLQRATPVAGTMGTISERGIQGEKLSLFRSGPEGDSIRPWLSEASWPRCSDAANLFLDCVLVKGFVSPGQKPSRKTGERIRLFAPISGTGYPVHQSTEFVQLSDRMIEMYLRKVREGLARIDNVRGVRLLTGFQQFRKFVRHIFDFRMPDFFSWAQHNDDNETIFGVGPIRIRKDAIHMLWRNATHRNWMRVWFGIQPQVKGSPVRAIDEWYFCMPSESDSAMRARVDVSLQGKAPRLRERAKQVYQSCVAIGIALVQKTPSAAGSQLHETTRPSEVSLGVQKTHDFRTGSFVEVHL